MFLPTRVSPCQGCSGKRGPLRSLERRRHSYSSQPSPKSPRIKRRMPSPERALACLRCQCDGAAESRHGLVEIAGVMQRGAEIGPGVGEVRLQFDGAAIGGDCFVESAQGIKRVAEITVSLREIW